MTIFTAFLFGYALAVTVLMGYAIWRVEGKKKEVVVESDTIAPNTEIEKRLIDAFAKQGIKMEVHSVPKTPVESIMVESEKTRKTVVDTADGLIPWFASISSKSDILKRDMDAVMVALKAVTEGVIKLQPSEKPKSKQAIESFVHELEYARDTFAKTPTQKKAVESIINNVKSYGVKS